MWVAALCYCTGGFSHRGKCIPEPCSFQNLHEHRVLSARHQCSQVCDTRLALWGEYRWECLKMWGRKVKGRYVEALHVRPTSDDKEFKSSDTQDSRTITRQLRVCPWQQAELLGDLAPAGNTYKRRHPTMGQAWEWRGSHMHLRVSTCVNM
jgi:hypothetical protein